MNRFLVSLSTIAVLSAAASAQCFETNFGTLLGTGDDALMPLQPLNFSFPMGGTFPAYTHAAPNTNGCIFLWNAATGLVGGTATGYSTTTATQLTNIRGAAGGAPRIAPFWRDLNLLPANNGGVWFNNSVPGRAVVTWANAVQFGSTTPIFTVQAQIFATGEVVYLYGPTIATSAAMITGISEGNAIVAVPGVDLSAGGNISATRLMFQQFTAPTGTAPFDLANSFVRFLPNAGGGYDQFAGPIPTCANHTPYGAGCYAISDSVYQSFATAALASPALQNTAITFTPSGGGYVVTSGGTFLPVGSVQATPTIVANGDDTEQLVPFTVGSFPGATGIAVCSNGFVSLATGNNPTWNVTPALMLNDPQTSFRSAHDMNPTIVGSGQIKHEESAALTMVTYDGVWDFSGTSVADANNIQIQLYPTGVVVIAWGTLSTLGASGIGYVVGMSPGGPSLDGGSIDLATALPAVVPGTNIPAMSLSASPPPVSTGSGGTLVTYTHSNVPEAAPSSGVRLGVTIISLGQDLPGTSLAFLGMPGCNLHLASLDLTIAFVDLVNNPVCTTQFAIPAAVTPGLQLFAQGAALIVPNSLPNGQNAFGATVSNGVASTIQPQ